MFTTSVVQNIVKLVPLLFALTANLPSSSSRLTVLALVTCKEKWDSCHSVLVLQLDAADTFSSVSYSLFFISRKRQNTSGVNKKIVHSWKPRHYGNTYWCQTCSVQDVSWRKQILEVIRYWCFRLKSLPAPLNCMLVVVPISDMQISVTRFGIPRSLCTQSFSISISLVQM